MPVKLSVCTLQYGEGTGVSLGCGSGVGLFCAWPLLSEAAAGAAGVSLGCGSGVGLFCAWPLLSEAAAGAAGVSIPIVNCLQAEEASVRMVMLTSRKKRLMENLGMFMTLSLKRIKIDLCINLCKRLYQGANSGDLPTCYGLVTRCISAARAGFMNLSYRYEHLEGGGQPWCLFQDLKQGARKLRLISRNCPHGNFQAQLAV